MRQISEPDFIFSCAVPMTICGYYIANCLEEVRDSFNCQEVFISSSIQHC